MALDIAALFDRAHAEIEQRLRQSQTLRWSPGDPAKFKQVYSVRVRSVWEVPLVADYLGRERTLHLVLTELFPFEPPAAYVTPSAYQEWPHAESSGRLCLWRAESPPNCFDPAILIADFFDRVGYLLNLSSASSDAARQEEFADEWLNYWAPTKKAEKEVLLAEVPPNQPAVLFSRELVRAGTPQAHGRTQYPLEAWNRVVLLATDQKALAEWGADFQDQTRPVVQEAGLYVPIGRLASISMPQNLPALFEWLSACGNTAAIEQIRSALGPLSEERRKVLLVFSLCTKRGGAMVGIQAQSTVRNPKPATGFHNRKTQKEAKRMALRDPVWTLTPLRVRRADRDWMRDRGVNRQSSQLASRHVVVVGCGMLGSPIAEHLARAGVGKITLIDADRFDPANIGRHVLGASYVGQAKAKGLAHHLKSSIPSISTVPIIEDVVTQSSIDIWGAENNLVICATADWRSEGFLMAQRLARGHAPPFLLTWLEPHAVSGHGLLSLNPGDDLFALFSGRGEPKLRCSNWPGGIPSIREAACQAAFNPAGAIAAAPSIAMVAELALRALLGDATHSSHSYWFSGVDTLKNLGGEPTPLSGANPGKSFVERALSEIEPSE